MVCIEKRPYTLYGRLATLHFRYLTCLLDRGHIKMVCTFPTILLLQVELWLYTKADMQMVYKAIKAHSSAQLPVQPLDKY